MVACMNDTAELFNFNYFERGEELGLSAYTDYHWIPERSHLEVSAFLQHMGAVGEGHTITDYGCAKGFFVRAACEQGHVARGFDISHYALSCALPVLKVYHVDVLDKGDVIVKSRYGFCKDVLEHCKGIKPLRKVFKNLHRLAEEWLIIIPLADNKRYLIPEYELDKTHYLRWSARLWMDIFDSYGFQILSIDYQVTGLKDKWVEQCSTGNLFLKVKSREGL
jgi:hypothetical protein